MKKIIPLIIVISLTWCNTVSADNIYLSCGDNTSFIINDKTKKIIMNGVDREVIEWRKEFITFHENEISKKISEATGEFPILDRITGYYSQQTKCFIKDGTKF